MLISFKASLGLVPAVLILVLIPITRVKAEDSVKLWTTEKNTGSLQQISQYVDQNSAPVVSVSQLSDVQTTDWQFQALQSLIQRYGCIAGYPDRSFKGDRAMTRFEFATALNTCLDRINQRIAADRTEMFVISCPYKQLRYPALAPVPSPKHGRGVPRGRGEGSYNKSLTVHDIKEDLATLQKLKQEFAAELTSLRGRVDALEAHTKKLEAQQFSPAIKFNAQLILAVVDASSSNKKNNSNLTVFDRLRLNFKTSFTKKDELLVRIQASNVMNPTPSINDTRLSFHSGTDTNNNVLLSKLQYTFRPNKNVKILVATGFNTYFDDWDVINPLKSDAYGAISRFGRYNPIYRLGGDTGAGVTYNLNKNIKGEVVYLAKNTNTPASGLFNGSYGALGQMIFYPSGIPTEDQQKKDKDIDNKVSKIAITYVNAYNNDGLAHNTGSLASNLGGRKISSNSIGIETNIKVKDSFFVGGWVGYINARTLTGEVKGNADVWNWAITLAFPDVKKSNLGGVIIGMQPKLTGTSAPLSGLPRHDPDTGFYIEGFYRFKINNKISITPGLIWLTAPNHNHQNGEIFEGVVRTTFDI